MMRQHMDMWVPAGGANDFLVVFNDAHNAWDMDVGSRIRSDARFADYCLPTRVRYSKLFRNLARRHQTAAEQPVAYRETIGLHVSAVTQEIVELLQDKSIFDATW